MFFPHSNKQSRPLEVLRPLDGPEQVEKSLREDHALVARAQRKQEENRVREGEIANERDEFELGRDKTYFALELIAAGVLLLACLATAIVLLAGGHDTLALVPFAGTGGLGGLIALLHQRSGKGR